MIRLLISSAGRRVELINCFKRAAEEIGIDVQVIAVDMEPSWSPACQVADLSYKVSECKSKEYLQQLLDISGKHKIDLIIPTIDTELLVLSKNRELFNETNTDILVGPTSFVEMARNKADTHHFAEKHNIKSPKTWILKEFLLEMKTIRYPLIAKPVDGSCSVGLYRINSDVDLKKIKGDKSAYIVQELFKGHEYTVNCFFDNGCQACVPHLRKLVRAGEVCFAETVRVHGFRVVADKIANAYPNLYGVICFQGFVNENNEVSLFEINARFGGGYPICDKAGGTFAKWILQKKSGIVPEYNDNWKEGVRMLRYDSAVFV